MVYCIKKEIKMYSFSSDKQCYFTSQDFFITQSKNTNSNSFAPGYGGNEFTAKANSMNNQ